MFTSLFASKRFPSSSRPEQTALPNKNGFVERIFVILTEGRKIYAPSRQIDNGYLLFFFEMFSSPISGYEGRVKDKLENIKEHLSTQATTPLQVPEINQDQLDIDTTLKRLTDESRHLQDIYSEILRMVPEAYKCNENLRNDFFDLACYVLLCSQGGAL